MPLHCAQGPLPGCYVDHQQGREHEQRQGCSLEQVRGTRPQAAAQDVDPDMAARAQRVG